MQTGSTIAPPVIVDMQDASDHPVPGFSGAVTMTRRRQDFAGTASTLSGTLVASIINGRATFSGLVMTGVEGNPLILFAAALGPTNAGSTTFTVVP